MNDKPETEGLMFKQKVADYRFEKMVKNSEFAFASGLLINPTHLPDALSEMRKDGWELISVIGEVTDTRKIAFFFKKIPEV